MNIYLYCLMWGVEKRNIIQLAIIQALWKCKVFCMWTVIHVIHWVLGYTTYGETLVAEKYGVYEDIQTKTGKKD